MGFLSHTNVNLVGDAKCRIMNELIGEGASLLPNSFVHYKQHTNNIHDNSHLQLNQHSGKPLSWVRLRDEHIIAVDHTTFINDARFASLLQSTTLTTLVSGGALSTTATPVAALGNSFAHAVPGGQERGNSSSLSWTLQIKYVNLEDAGWYECQLATEPKMSAKVQLFVISK